jgi:surfactin synthase thioesterase subunit
MLDRSAGGGAAVNSPIDDTWHQHWFLTPIRRPQAATQLFCLPYAGGGASAYRRWPVALGADIEVHAVRLPGRESRIGEPPEVDPAALAAAIAECADRPYALFGHSMGGRLCFEVVRHLRTCGATLPERIYVSACRPPDVTTKGPLDGLSRVSDDELVARLMANGSLPAQIAAEPDVLDLFLPVLRADFSWLDNYTYLAQPALPVAIVGFAGTHDRAVPADQMPGWQRHTTAGFSLHMLPGDHFFLHERLAELAALIRSDLRPPNHRIPLGGWSVWRDAVLRTTGFPADALDVFTAPACAQAADAYLDGSGDEQTFDKHYAEATGTGTERARAIAADARFREAVTWQNPGMLGTLDALVSGSSKKKPSVIRRREMMVARYWQRYCAKNETVGFFGPVCWVRVDDAAPATVTARPGPELLRQRKVFFESWALQAYGQTLATDSRVRPWLRPVLQPYVSLGEGRAYHPPRPPAPLSKPELTALRACDGTRTAMNVVGDLGLPKESDGYLLLDRLVERGLLRWDADLPLTPSAEPLLADRIRAIEDTEARARALAGLDRLRAARDGAAAAAGDPEALRHALAFVDHEFTALTGQPPSRRHGQTYAARRLCYEDTARDLDVVFGPALLEELKGPLDLLLRAARWLCAELADVYSRALGELYGELCDEGADDHTEVNLAELWFLAQGMLFGSGPRPVDAVTQAFQKRWAALFGLDGDDDSRRDTRELRLRAVELDAPVAEAFPDRAVRWSAGRLHSPDLQICASSVEAVNRGDFTVVLGEMHAAWPTFDTSVFVPFHPRRDELVDALAADLGPARVHPLFPPDWPRVHGRVASCLAGPTDVQLGIGPAPGADRSRLIPACELVVRPGPEGTLVVGPPHRRAGGAQPASPTKAATTGWPLIEVFSGLLAMHAVDAFKLLATRRHTPRITVDKLVISRETWRTTVAATGLATVTTDRARFLAARRWRAALGLPERVFVKLGTETKPCYVDFRSPLYVLSLCALIRAAHGAGGAEVDVVVTEMLPTPDQAWVPDANNLRYFSELRIQVSDHG